MEKSDLKYPLIHGQGRQVSEQPPPRTPQLLTAEAGVPLCLWLVSWGLLQGHRVFLPQPRVPEGHSPPLCFTVLLLGLFAVTSHLPCPQARLLGTLAVSRGLGDHQLRVLDTNIQLKPFLLSVPQVRGQQSTPASFLLPRK